METPAAANHLPIFMTAPGETDLAVRFDGRCVDWSSPWRRRVLLLAAFEMASTGVRVEYAAHCAAVAPQRTGARLVEGIMRRVAVVCTARDADNRQLKKII